MEAKDKALNLTRKWWLSKAIATLPLLASALLLSCVDGQEEVATSNGGGEATVRLHISVGPIGDLNATRATDTNATEGELINSLCVFIMNGNTIEAKIQPDLTDDTDAEAGNLEEYTSDQITLTAGTKTIYAFANWENAGSEAWKSLIDKGAGETIGSTDLQILIEDPASCVDIEGGKYIPMSGSASATVSATSYFNSIQTVTVELIRLVGKVEVKASAMEQDVTINSLTFSGTANSVWLFSENKGSETISLGKDIEKKELNKTITSDSEENTIATFYVNESDRSEESNGFGIKLATDSYNDIVEATAYTSTITNIPRNYIYTVDLTLDTYSLDMQPKAMTSILDVVGEKEYDVNAIEDTDGNYSLTLYDVTSSFSLTPKLTKSGSEVSNVSWTLTNDEETYTEKEKDGTSLPSIKESSGEFTISELTATPEYEYYFVLYATWTDDVTHTRTYNLTVEFVDSDEAPVLKSDTPAKQSGEAATPVIMKKRETFK